VKKWKVKSEKVEGRKKKVKGERWKVN